MLYSSAAKWQEIIYTVSVGKWPCVTFESHFVFDVSSSVFVWLIASKALMKLSS